MSNFLENGWFLKCYHSQRRSRIISKTILYLLKRGFCQYFLNRNVNFGGNTHFYCNGFSGAAYMLEYTDKTGFISAIVFIRVSYDSNKWACYAWLHPVSTNEASFTFNDAMVNCRLTGFICIVYYYDIHIVCIARIHPSSLFTAFFQLIVHLTLSSFIVHLTSMERCILYMRAISI